MANIQTAATKQMYEQLCKMSPAEVHNMWKWFMRLTEVPRRSGYHVAIVNFLKKAAEELKVEWKIDAANNFVMKAPANAPEAKGVILQGHSDMVATPFPCDFHKWDEDPLKLQLDGDKLTACGTTLGADNGIGVACALALLENRDQFKHGPIEVLVTSDEETGLIGANKLDEKEGLVTGKYLINIDSEDWGIITVSSAGTATRWITAPVTYENAGDKHMTLELKLEGFKGGHSGVNINLYPANVNKWMSEIVFDMVRMAGARLVSMNGGHAHNAVPSSCVATVVVPTAQVAAAIERARLAFHSFMIRYANIETKEPKLLIKEVGAADANMQVLHHNCTLNMIHMVEQLPHGVFRYFGDASLPDLVETSQNLSRVIIPTKEDSKIAKFQCMARSAVDGYMDGIAKINEAIAVAHGAECEKENEDVGGWPADLSSRLLRELKDCYHKMEGSHAQTLAIHAGLENSVIMSKYPSLGLESVSIGPTIYNPHTPDEVLYVSTANKCYTLVKNVVDKLAN
jgi:dipeptidase D